MHPAEQALTGKRLNLSWIQGIRTGKVWKVWNPKQRRVDPEARCALFRFANFRVLAESALGGHVVCLPGDIPTLRAGDGQAEAPRPAALRSVAHSPAVAPPRGAECSTSQFIITLG